MRRILTCSLTVILFFGGFGPFAYPKERPYGGELIWGTCYKPTAINPLFTTQSISISLQSLIFSSLVRWNPKGEIEPDLAGSWEVSPDGLVYTFYLRKGVRFHDGIECTAEDVKFTFDKLTDPELNSPFRPLFQLVSEFKATGPYVFRIILKEPHSSFIYKLIREVLPKHILENADLRNSPFNYHPVGSGPFRFKEWDKDDRITLEYNPDYYEGRPYLDEIIVRSFSDSRELWAKLMRQEVDLALFIEEEDYKVLKDDPAFKAYPLAMDRYYALVYNLDDPILGDRRIREAIAHSIDRKRLISEIASGYGIECNGPFYPDSIGFNPEVKPIAFNPKNAEEILKEAGWSDTDKDGILEKDGSELELRLLVDSRNEIYRRMAMLIRQQLQEVGIKLIVQLYNNDNDLTEEFLGKNKSSAQLKSLLAGIGPEEAGTNWFKQGTVRMDNLWVYNNSEVERYFSLGRTTQDKKKREWIYQEVHRFIYEDQPVCFLFYPFHFHVVSSKFQDTDDFFTLSMPINTMRNWSLKEEYLKKGGDRGWRLSDMGQR